MHLSALAVNAFLEHILKRILIVTLGSTYTGALILENVFFLSGRVGRGWIDRGVFLKNVFKKKIKVFFCLYGRVGCGWIDRGSANFQTSVPKYKFLLHLPGVSETSTSTQVLKVSALVHVSSSSQVSSSSSAVTL
jgi:hypothetical protein